MNLLGPVPLLYRWMAILALFAATFFAGWVTGHNGEAKKLAKFEGGIEALGQAQITHTKAVDIATQKTMKEADDAHEAASVALAHYVAAGWVPSLHTGSGAVPKLSANTAQLGQGSAESVPAATGTPPREPYSGEVQQALADCEQTTLDFIDISNAWRNARSAAQ